MIVIRLPRVRIHRRRPPACVQPVNTSRRSAVGGRSVPHAPTGTDATPTIVMRTRTYGCAHASLYGPTRARSAARSAVAAASQSAGTHCATLHCIISNINLTNIGHVGMPRSLLEWPCRISAGHASWRKARRPVGCRAWRDRGLSRPMIDGRASAAAAWSARAAQSAAYRPGASQRQSHHIAHTHGCVPTLCTSQVRKQVV